MPIAFAQSGLLDAHITDHYLPDAVVSFFSKLAEAKKSRILSSALGRHHPDLPSQLFTAVAD